MIWRFYIVPIVGDGLSRQTARRCKIGDIIGPMGINPSKGIDTRADGHMGELPHNPDWSWVLFGGTQNLHDMLLADPEIIPLGAPFETKAERDAMEQLPEANADAVADLMNLPRKPNITTGEVMKKMMRLSKFGGKVQPYPDILTFVNYHRDTLISSFPVPQVNKVLGDLNTLGYDTSFIVGTTTVGEALDVLSDQIGVQSSKLRLYDYDLGLFRQFTMLT